MDGKQLMHFTKDYKLETSFQNISPLKYNYSFDPIGYINEMRMKSNELNKSIDNFINYPPSNSTSSQGWWHYVIFRVTGVLVVDLFYR